MAKLQPRSQPTSRTSEPGRALRVGQRLDLYTPHQQSLDAPAPGRRRDLGRVVSPQPRASPGEGLSRELWLAAPPAGGGNEGIMVSTTNGKPFEIGGHVILPACLSPPLAPEFCLKSGFGVRQTWIQVPALPHII